MTPTILTLNAPAVKPRMQLTLLLALTFATFFLPTPSQAQVYRIVGPDGKVTFSDKAPVDPQARPKADVANGGVAANGNASGLPYALQQVATKYPVTLYTGNDCNPCGSGRAMLLARGVPFTEKTVNSNDDIQTLQRLSGETALPFLTIGSQQLKGFADTEWTQYLSAAGYPASSALPANYRAPLPSPLVLVKAAAAPAGAAPAVKASAVPAVPVTPISSASGIRF